MIQKLLLILLVLPLMVSGQRIVNYGVQYDSAYIPVTPLVPSYYEGVKGESAARSVSLRPFCPKPGNQKSMPACVAYAAGYSAMSIMQAIRDHNTQSSITNENSFSPSFLFYHIRSDSADCMKSGARIDDAIQSLKEKGNCFMSEFFSPASCFSVPPATAYRSAAEHRIKEGARLFDNDATALQKEAVIKRVLRDSAPVIITIRLYQSFVNALTPVWSKGNTTADNNYGGGSHALVVVGYDETTRTFELMNSWGSAWGNGGFIKVDCEQLAEICREAYRLYMYDSPDVLPLTPPGESLTVASGKPQRRFEVKGKFSLVQLLNTDSISTDSISPVPVRYNRLSRMYEVSKGPLNQRDTFQVMVSDMTSGKYVYIFSCDPAGKVRLHWPRQIENKQLSQVIPYREAEIYLPEDTGLQFRHTGTEYLCVLYSEEQIPDISDRLSRIGDYRTGDFRSMFDAAFSDILIKDDLLNPFLSNMGVQARSDVASGIAIPLILRINVL